MAASWSPISDYKFRLDQPPRCGEPNSASIQSFSNSIWRRKKGLGQADVELKCCALNPRQPPFPIVLGSQAAGMWCALRTKLVAAEPAVGRYLRFQ